MNAAAYLTNQGWRGDGHALHHSGRGITKPLRVSQKANVLGVGKKQHDAHADQWWARAFDDTLKGLNTTKNEATGKTEGVAFGSGAQALQMMGTRGAKWVGQSGLYSNFVRGESLSGTLSPKEKDHRETQSQSEDQGKRKTGSKDLGLTTAATEDIENIKRKRWQRKEDIAEYSGLADVDTVQQRPKDVGVEEQHQKPQEKPKGSETKGQRRQKKRENKARRAPEAGESRELLKQSRETASQKTSMLDRPERRSEEQLHTAGDVDPVAMRASKPSSHRQKKRKSGKRRRAVESPRTS